MVRNKRKKTESVDNKLQDRVRKQRQVNIYYNQDKLKLNFLQFSNAMAENCAIKELSG